MTTADVMRVRQMRAWLKDGTARRLRVQADISQAEMSRGCYVTTAAVSRWESGDRTPRGQAAIRYARILDKIAKAEVSA